MCPSTQTHPPRAHERGAMLLELVFAITIALVVGGAMVSTTVRQSAHRAVNLETTLASNAIADVFARLRAAPFAALPSLHGIGFDVPSQHGQPGGLTPVPGDPDGLPGRIEVAVSVSAGPAVLYRVTVSVHWTGAIGARRETIVGLIGERRS